MVSNIAGLGVQARGQTLGAATDLVGGALDSSTGLAQTAIPAYLQNDLGWAELGNDLTPQQKMQLGALGAGGDLLSLLF